MKKEEAQNEDVPEGGDDCHSPGFWRLRPTLKRERGRERERERGMEKERGSLGTC